LPLHLDIVKDFPPLEIEFGYAPGHQMAAQAIVVTETWQKWLSTLDLGAEELAGGRRPEKKCGLSAGKIAASCQPGRKKYAKPPPNIWLKSALSSDVNEKLAITIQSSYDHAVKLQCCTKISKSRKKILFRTMWAIDFYVELYVVHTKK